MKNMNVKQIRLTILLLVVVVLAVVFRFGYMNISERVSEIENKNKVLSNQVNTLKSYQLNEQTYKDNITKIDNYIQDLANRYAPAITNEGTLKFIKSLEEYSKIEVNNISFDKAENLFNATFQNADGMNVTGSSTKVNLTFNASFQALTECMKYINNYADRMNVSEININYNNETSLLTGTMIINQYSLTGLGREYNEPEFGGLNISTDDIFGTVD